MCVREYLHYANCKLSKKLVEECTENIIEVNIAVMALFVRGSKCKSSCKICVVLIAIVFAISNGTGAYFIYYKYMNHI